MNVVTSRNDYDNDDEKYEATMPFLLWMPIIVMSGMWKIAGENTRAILQASAPKDK